MKPFKPLRSEKFAQEVANRIKTSIFDGTYGSGDRLPSENEMAGMFGVSSVTVRQAIRILESSNILYTRQGADGGIFVAEADASAVSSYLSDMLKLKRVTQRDLTMTRMIFEPDIAAMVARVWESDDLDEVHENIRQANTVLAEGNLDAARLLNLTFHRRICSLTRNPVVIFTLNSVIDVLEENVLRIKMDKTFVRDEIRAHERIVEKIQTRSPEGSRREMHTHITLVHEKLEAAYDNLNHKKLKKVV